MVVPEFSALSTSSGDSKVCLPLTYTISLSWIILTPIALHDETVARVSLEYKGFLIIDSPSTREDIAKALWL
jgi:hypothetical protein